MLKEKMAQKVIEVVMGRNAERTTDEVGALLTLYLPKTAELLDVYIHRQSDGKVFYAYGSWWNQGEGFHSNNFFSFVKAFLKWQYAAKRLEKASRLPVEEVAPAEETLETKALTEEFPLWDDEEEDEEEFVF